MKPPPSIRPVEPTDDDPAIVCPKDGGEMRRFEIDGVRVDRCKLCGGIWLDKGERERLLERMPDADGLIARFDSASWVEMHEESPEGWFCPRDGTPLITVKDPKQPHIEFELCPKCGGVYFDAGELSDLSRHTLAERLRALLGKHE
ncbi:MAG: zf-TFIIB domain-containing protein [Planctomycetota bacterium]